MKKKILSILLSLSMLTALAVPVMAEDSATVENVTTELFAEDFEGDDLISGTSGASTWYKTTNGFHQAEDIVHGGKKSLGYWWNGGSLSYQGKKSVGNYAYEFWFYDNGKTGAALVGITGTKQDGTEVGKDQLMFGVKSTASKTKYIVGPTITSSITRSVGWHHVVMDTTTKGKCTIYVDGTKAYTVTNTVYNVTGICVLDWWEKKPDKFCIDDMKAYATLDEVPVYRKNVMESIKFASGEDVEGIDDAVPADGNITITFKEDMNIAAAENFTLLKRAVTSTSDADYVATTVTFKDATATSATISVDSLEADTEYRLGFTGLTTEAGKTVATDFIEFSTYEDLTWDRTTPKGLVYEENFDEELTDWTLNGVKSSDYKAHSGNKALLVNNNSQAWVSAKYNGATQMGNYVYSFWFYDEYRGADYANKASSGAALFDLTKTTTTTDEKGNEKSTTVSEKALFGVKHASIYGKYILGDTDTSGISRTAGWHYVVIDATTAGKMTAYVDGVKGNTKSITVNPVTGMRFFSGWNNADASFYFDDLQVYKKLENVPVYKSEIIDSAVFDNGTAAEGAEDIIKVSGNLNINYKKAMSGISADNFELLVRDNTSTNDANFVEAGFTVVSSGETSTAISVTDLQPSKEYRLVMKNLTAADETVMADDYITFKTSEIVDLEESVVDYVAFSNGTRLPSTGIPETFGDLVVNFAMEMNPETLTSETVTLTKADGTVIENLVADASSTTYTINAESIGLEANTTYTLTVTTGAKTATGNYAYQNYSVSFTTSKDLKHQDVLFEDSFENGTDNWSVKNNQPTTEIVNSGKTAIQLGYGGYAKYKGTVPTNAVYEVWLYDTGSVNDNIVLQLQGEKADGTTSTIQFGSKNGNATQYWLYWGSDTDTILLGRRSKGWHRFIIDFRNPDEVNYYIDDDLVAVRPEAIRKITAVRIFNQFNYDYMTADDFKIWNAIDYDVISKIDDSKAFICDENYNALVDYNAGDKVYIAVNVNNQQAKAQDAVLIVGEYKDNVLSKVVSSAKTNIESGDNVNLRVEYTIPENFADYELKAFVWDSLETMKPIMPASDPKAVTAVFLGGSITQGSGVASTETSQIYVALTGEYLKSTYGSGSDVTIVNSGVGGRGSAFGSKYFYNYVGTYNPDILFVEYAVNDRAKAGGIEANVKKTLEQIVQKALDLPKKPRIVFIYTTTEALDSCAAWHGEVAEYYGIPEINLEQAVKTEIIGDANATTWTNFNEYLGDGVHPNVEGYKFYADKIIEALKTDGFLKAATDAEPNFQ